MTDTTQDKGKKKFCGCSFNYCLVSKLLVAIPALPITGYMGSILFDDMAMKFIGALGSVALVVYAAIKIDEIPALQKKIVDRK